MSAFVAAVYGHGDTIAASVKAILLPKPHADNSAARWKPNHVMAPLVCLLEQLLLIACTLLPVLHDAPNRTLVEHVTQLVLMFRASFASHFKVQVSLLERLMARVTNAPLLDRTVCNWDYDSAFSVFLAAESYQDAELVVFAENWCAEHGDAYVLQDLIAPKNALRVVEDILSVLDRLLTGERIPGHTGIVLHLSLCVIQRELQLFRDTLNALPAASPKPLSARKPLQANTALETKKRSAQTHKKDDHDTSSTQSDVKEPPPKRGPKKRPDTAPPKQRPPKDDEDAMKHKRPAAKPTEVEDDADASEQKRPEQSQTPPANDQRSVIDMIRRFERIKTFKEALQSQISAARPTVAIYMALVQQGLRAYDFNVIVKLCKPNYPQRFTRAHGWTPAVLSQSTTGEYMLPDEFAASQAFIDEAVRIGKLILRASPDQQSQFSPAQRVLFHTKPSESMEEDTTEGEEKREEQTDDVEEEEHGEEEEGLVESKDKSPLVLLTRGLKLVCFSQ